MNEQPNYVSSVPKKEDAIDLLPVNEMVEDCQYNPVLADIVLKSEPEEMEQHGAE